MEVLPNERKETTTAFLVRALDHFQALGIAVARIMTDNGSAYRSHLIADLCRSRRMRHIFTRPIPRAPTARPSASSRPRCANGLTHALTITPSSAPTLCCPGLHSYNHHRTHQGIGGRTPISRLPRDNLLQLDT
jgi:transposase InsO family protein